MSNAVFNGRGHTIKNYRVQRGLFISVNSSAVLNLTVENFDVTSGSGTNYYTGAIVAYGSGSIFFNLISKLSHPSMKLDLYTLIYFSCLHFF